MTPIADTSAFVRNAMSAERAMRFPVGSLLAGLLVFAWLCGTAAAAPPKAKPAAKPVAKPVAKLSRDQFREVNRLLALYRAAGTDLKKKQEMCDSVLAVDPLAATLMMAAVEHDLQPQMRRYSSKFQQQAATAVKNKLAQVDLNKVAELRKTVLDLQTMGDAFTKELIVKKGDPALHELQNMLILGRTDVLEGASELQAERDKLSGLGQLWEKCLAAVPADTAVPADAANPSATPLRFEDYLQGEEELAASLALPMDAKTRAVLAMNARLAEKIDPEEARTVLACNLMRNLLGLPALVIDLKLCETARDHSADMEKLKFFAHESPVEGKKTPWDRAKRFGTTASGENIFAGNRDGKVANEAWFHSPGHHKNMLGNHVRIGVGRTGVHFTEMFGS